MRERRRSASRRELSEFQRQVSCEFGTKRDAWQGHLAKRNCPNFCDRCRTNSEQSTTRGRGTWRRGTVRISATGVVRIRNEARRVAGRFAKGTVRIFTSRGGMWEAEDRNHEWTRMNTNLRGWQPGWYVVLFVPIRGPFPFGFVSSFGFAPPASAPAPSRPASPPIFHFPHSTSTRISSFRTDRPRLQPRAFLPARVGSLLGGRIVFGRNVKSKHSFSLRLLPPNAS
jgi:hypothetical protein